MGAAERPERDRATGELADVADGAGELVEVGQHPLAHGTTIRPASVSCSRRFVRVKSRTPSAASSRRIWSDRLGCAM